MPLHLRPDLTQSLIEACHGDVEGLVVGWEHLAETRKGFPESRQKSTIYRWLSEGLPSRGEEVVAFCALLDVDPLTLFDYRRNGYFSNFSKIRLYLQRGLAAAGVLSPLYRMYRPGPYWPANDMARRCYGRDWFGVEFDNGNNWRTTDYAQVKACFRNHTRSHPRAVHIAYCRCTSPVACGGSTARSSPSATESSPTPRAEPSRRFPGPNHRPFPSAPTTAVAPSSGGSQACLRSTSRRSFHETKIRVPSRMIKSTLGDLKTIIEFDRGNEVMNSEPYDWVRERQLSQSAQTAIPHQHRSALQP